MGFFSWITQDTDRSIPSTYSDRRTFPVYMHDNKGNVFKEDNYEGYGEFGGKDYYELLAEMNGKSDRLEGITLEFGIHAIRNSKTGQVFKGNGHDFFNWQDDKILDGKSANELLEMPEWEQFTIREEGVK